MIQGSGEVGGVGWAYVGLVAYMPGCLSQFEYGREDVASSRVLQWWLGCNMAWCGMDFLVG